jgi:5-methylcytosine-specific restriction endonuclease McrA
MSWRCQGCRGYFRSEPYRRIGLGSVCSDQCASTVAVRQRGGKHRETSRITAHHISAGNRRHLDDIRSPRSTSNAGAVVKELVVRGDGGCGVWGPRQGLHVHHINYRSQGVDNQEHNLILLCGTHHASVHSNKRLWQPILRAYIWLYYVECRQLFLLEVRSRISQES